MNKKLALDCLESFIRIQTMCETVAGCQDLIDRLKSEILGEEIAPIVEEKPVDKFKVGDKVYCDYYNKQGVVTKDDGLSLSNIPITVKFDNNHFGLYTIDGRICTGGSIRLKKI